MKYMNVRMDHSSKYPPSMRKRDLRVAKRILSDILLNRNAHR